MLLQQASAQTLRRTSSTSDWRKTRAPGASSPASSSTNCRCTVRRFL